MTPQQTLSQYTDEDDKVYLGNQHGIDVVRKVINAIKLCDINNSTTIKRLSISGISLSADDVKMITNGIRHNNTITRFHLYECNIGDTGASHVADLLQYNTTIEYVDLAVNVIGDNGAVALGNALLNNTRSAVVYMVLRFNSIQFLPDSFALLAGRSLKTLWLNNNPLQDPPFTVINQYNMDAVMDYLAAKRKRIIGLTFLLGFHNRLGNLSSINKWLNHSNIFDPNLLCCIFELVA